MTTPDTLFWRLTTLLCGAGFLALALFIAAPGLDLWAAGLFFDGAGFPLRADPAIAALRQFYKLVFATACVAVALTVLARIGAALAPALAPAEGWSSPLRLWLFFCALLATGPGLIVNLVFKSFWGRARPEAVEAFGGQHPLTPPFGLSDACASNCSFVSGEGAAAAALAFGLLAAFWPALRTAQARRLAVAASALWLAGAGLIRMGPGKHFLSDTLFAFVLMGLTAAALYRVFALGGARARAGAAAQDVARAARILLRAARAAPRLLATTRLRRRQDG